MRQCTVWSLQKRSNGWWKLECLDFVWFYHVPGQKLASRVFISLCLSNRNHYLIVTVDIGSSTFFWGICECPNTCGRVNHDVFEHQDFNLVGKYPAEASARVFQAGWTSLSAPPCQNWSSWPTCSEFWFNWIHVVTQLHPYSCHCSQPCGLCGPGVWCSGELCWCLVHLVVCEGRWQSFVCFVFDMRHLPRCWALLHQPNWTRLWAERAKSRDFSELYPETVPLSWTFGLGGVPGFSVVPWQVDL